jgi:hypothetical protein
LTRALVAGALLGIWLAVRLLRPGLKLRLPAAISLPWRFLVPPAVILWAGLASLPGAVLLGALFLAVHAFGTRTLGHLRREVAGEVEACRAALQADGRPAAFPDVAAFVLIRRYARRGMSRAEASALASRSGGLDDLAAQIALREGGLGAYASYLRRFGKMTEAPEGEAMVLGDRFPDEPGSP